MKLLVQLKIYEKPETSEEDKSQTVKVMLRELEDILEIQVEGTNLNKKENLSQLLEAIKKWLQTSLGKWVQPSFLISKSLMQQLQIKE